MRTFPLSTLRSVDLIVPDVEAATVFYTQIWGLDQVAQANGVVYLRGAGTDPYLVSLQQGGAAAITCCTYRAAPETDLATLYEQMLAHGAQGDTEISPSEKFGGGIGFCVLDRAGRRTEIVQGDVSLAPISDHAHMPVRLAHVNINCADIEADIAFYQEAMGFELTDRSKMMGFLSTNADHHAVVLAQADCDTLNHISFLHDTSEDMMKAGGRMCDAGYAIGWGPGRHGPGDNVFLYFVDPFGIVIEHTAEVLQVDENYRFRGPDEWVWPKGRTDQWGIAPPKTEQCKAAQLAIPFVK